jgi:hypothetical protein
MRSVRGLQMLARMSLGRRIVQRATTRVYRRGIRVIVRKPDETKSGVDKVTPTDSNPSNEQGRASSSAL